MNIPLDWLMLRLLSLLFVYTQFEAFIVVAHEIVVVDYRLAAAVLKRCYVEVVDAEVEAAIVHPCADVESSRAAEMQTGSKE